MILKSLLWLIAVTVLDKIFAMLSDGDGMFLFKGLKVLSFIAWCGCVLWFCYAAGAWALGVMFG